MEFSSLYISFTDVINISGPRMEALAICGKFRSI